MSTVNPSSEPSSWGVNPARDADLASRGLDLSPRGLESSGRAVHAASQYARVLEIHSQNIDEDIRESERTDWTKIGVRVLSFVAGALLGVLGAAALAGVMITPVGWAAAGAFLLFALISAAAYGMRKGGLKEGFKELYKSLMLALVAAGIGMSGGLLVGTLLSTGASATAIAAAAPIKQIYLGAGTAGLIFSSVALKQQLMGYIFKKGF